MIKNINKKNSGNTLIETLFYISLFAVLSIVLIDVMIIMTKSFKETRIQGELIQGSTILERISRELRQADDFSYGSNILTVNTKDISNNSKTVTFTFANPNIQIVDSVLGNLGNLNTANISVSGFVVSPITTIKGKAANLSLSIRSNNDSTNRIENFYNTVVLRGDYQN